jgi:hypothetical protein
MDASKRAGLGLLLLAGLSLPRAMAHPFGQQYYALRSEIRMSADGPEVMVAGEVPIMVVLTEFRHFFRGVVRPGPAEDSAYLERKLDQLREGLSLEVNGQPAVGRWVALDDPRNGKSAEGSFTYFVTFEPSQPWDPEAERLTLELGTGAYRDVPLWFTTHAVVDHGLGSWSVADNSARAILGEAADDPVAFMEPDGWSQDPALRTVSVVFQRSVGAGEPPPARRGGCWS